MPTQPYNSAKKTPQEILWELSKENAELKAENERLKTQYNCYTCGNCKGKEDYKNLEKHHIGLRKQFDKKVQTLQEIKKYIAKICKEECGYVQKKRCLDCDCRYGTILDFITKAEEE